MWTYRRSGKIHQRGAQDHRTAYERDYTRVIHCPAFRRLQRKTQILGTTEGDFHRTRLTHSLEVASIGVSLVRRLVRSHQAPNIEGLLPSDDLIEVICLLHDIGHPPFGHGGEAALNYKMKAVGGFESNAQTLRLLTKIEKSYGNYGLDLTRRTLLGILKYPAPRSIVTALALKDSVRMNDWVPPKAYFDSESSEVQWILEPLSLDDQTLFQSLSQKPTTDTHGQTMYCSLDCSIMDVADDIAYGVHDLEDAIHLGLLHREQLDTVMFRTLLADCGLSEHVVSHLFDPFIEVRKGAIGELVNYFIASVDLKLADERFQSPLLRYHLQLPPNAQALLAYFMQLIYQLVIDSHDARILEYAGQMILLQLFDAFSSNPEQLLDIKNRDLWRAADDDIEQMRVICDYIANMTDEDAHRTYARLFGFSTTRGPRT